MLEWQTGKVIDIQDASASTKRFFIEIPAITNCDF